MAEIAIKERPILFSGAMVKALLDGRKTQTRRIVKPQPYDEWRPTHYDRIHKMIDGEFPLRNGEPIDIGWGALNADGDWGIVCPYGQPGDHLWTREACSIVEDHSVTVPDSMFASHIKYKCDDSKDLKFVPLEDWRESYASPGSGWRPSIHMPRWASRINLEIKSVRVERLHEISEADAIAEGIEQGEPGAGMWKCYREKSGWESVNDPCMSYRTLWESINGPDSWNANPWVWVVEFTRITT